LLEFSESRSGERSPGNAMAFSGSAWPNPANQRACESLLESLDSDASGQQHGVSSGAAVARKFRGQLEPLKKDK
jgi:hypothetical protein